MASKGIRAGGLYVEMWAELARLQNDMDKAKRMVGAAAKDIGNSAKVANDNIGKMGASSKLASRHLLNLGFQVQDITQGLLTGQKPMTVFIQQGGQVAGIMAQAGIGVGGLVKAVGSMALNLVKAHPVIAAIAAVAGLAAIGIKRFTNELDKTGEIKAYANSLGLTHKEMEKLEKKAGTIGVTFGDVFKGLGRTVAQYLPAIPAAWKAVEDALGTGFDFVMKAASVAGSAIYAAFVGTFNLLKVVWQNFPAIMGEAIGVAVNTAIKLVQDLLNAGVAGINWLVDKSNSILGTSFGHFNDVQLQQVQVTTGNIQKAGAAIRDGYAGAFHDAQAGQASFYKDLRKNTLAASKDRLKAAADEIKADRTAKQHHDAHAESLRREMEAIEATIEQNNKLADSYLVSNAAAFVAEVRAKAVADAIKKQADIETYVAAKLREAVSERGVAGAKEVAALRDQTDARSKVNDQVKLGLLTSQQADDLLRKEQQLLPLTIAMTVAQGEQKERLRKILSALNDEIDRANGAARESQQNAALEKSSDDMRLLQGQIQLTERLGAARLGAMRGLHGEALEDELARLNHENENQLNLQRALVEAYRLRKNGMGDLADATIQAAVAANKLSDIEFYTDKGEKGVDRLNDRLRETIDILQQMGGLGGVLGNLLGFLSGDLDSLGGPLGFLLRTNVTGEDGEVHKLGQVLKTAIGDQSDTLATAIKGIGLGMVASNAVFGKQGTVGQLGSAIGGALGGKIGEKFLTTGLSKIFSGLGDFAGPLGSILGALAGGLIGKLFGSTPKGTVTIAGGQVVAGKGKDQQMLQNAQGAASSILDLFNQVAGALGGSVNSAISAISIGQRKGNWVVDSLGRGNTKGSGVLNFGADQTAAVNYAIQQMLQRGVIDGIDAKELALLKSGKDFQTQLAKAVSLHEVTEMLNGGSSQLVQSVNAMRSKFANYIAVMKEAGSSIEDLTRVQQMQADQIKAIIDAAGDSFRSTFYTDAQNLAFAQAKIHSVLDPLGKGAVDTVAEYLAEVAKAQQDTSDTGLAYLDTLYSLSDQFGVLKAAADAAAAQAAADKAQRDADAAAAAQARQQQVDAAKDALRQAYDSSASELQQTIDGERAFATSMRQLRMELLSTGSAADDYEAKLANLRRTGALAVLGNADAKSQLESAIRDFLPAAKAQARSEVEYQRAVLMAAQYANNAANSADARASVAQRTLDQQTKAVGALIDINSGVLSLNDAMQQLIKLTGGTSTPKPSTGKGTPFIPPMNDNQQHHGRLVTDPLYYLSRTHHRDRHGSDDGSDAVQQIADRLDAIEQNTAQAAATSAASASSNKGTAKLLRRASRLGRGALATTNAA